MTLIDRIVAAWSDPEAQNPPLPEGFAAFALAWLKERPPTLVGYDGDGLVLTLADGSQARFLPAAEPGAMVRSGAIGISRGGGSPTVPVADAVPFGGPRS